MVIIKCVIALFFILAIFETLKHFTFLGLVAMVLAIGVVGAVMKHFKL